MFTPPKTTKAPKKQRTSVKGWLKGVVTAFDAGRMPIDGLIEASNVVLDQDGTVRPRPSLSLYGPQPLGNVLGEIFEFKKDITGGKFETWMLSMQVVSGVANLYVAKGESSAWTKITGKDYDVDAPVHYFQIQGKVMVMNGVDTLSFYDIAAGTITSYTALTKPASPTLDVNTGLSGSAFKVYYAVTANSSVGETDADTALTVSVSTDRNSWNKDTQNIKIKWTTVTGVKSWNVYMGTAADGTGDPTMYAIATGLDATTLAFTDNGTFAQDITRPLPSRNSTAGPRATRGTVIDGRAWMAGDTDNPYHVWYGGDFGYEIDFSPSHGGGYTPVGNGTKEVPVDVWAFRDGQGNPKITVFTQSSNGKGKRYLLSSREWTYGSFSGVYWHVQEDTGDDGTDAPDGVVIYNNSLWYPSRDGFKTTGTRPQLQNVLSTDRVSNTIQPDISRLNTKAMPKAVGVAHEGAIYWALPVGDGNNSEVWVLDLNREGAWMKPWNIAADWMWLYSDNSGTTRFLALVDGKICELNNLQRTNDAGVGFNTSGSSGQINFSEDGMDWARLIDVTFRLSRPQGRINLTVSGFTEDGIRTWSVSDRYGGVTSVAGWGEPSVLGIEGFGRHAWSGTETPPQTTGEVTKDISVEIDEDVQWWSYSWSSLGTGVSYQMSNVIAEFVNIGTKDRD